MMERYITLLESMSCVQGSLSVVGGTECCRGTEDRDGADRRMAGLKQQRNVGYISAGIRSEIQRSGECDRGRFHGQADQEAPGSVVSGSRGDANSFEEPEISSDNLK